MKRILFLLFLFCFVFAQSDDAFPDDPFSEMRESGISAEEELFGDVPLGSDQSQPTPVEPPPAESSPPAAPADDSFLDDIIGKQPIITQPSAPPPAAAEPAPPEPAAQPAAAVPVVTQPPVSAPVVAPPAVSPTPTKPVSPLVAGSGPDINEPPVRNAVTRQPSADTGIKYSSTPDIDVAAVQETPDIPQFSHRKHIKDIGAECVQCHQTLFSESVRGIKTGPPMKEICSQCHNGTDAPAEVLVGFSEEKKYVKTHVPLFSHTKHLEHTERCTICHIDIFGELKKIKIPPPMPVCTECHNNDEANANCRVCHEDPSKLKPRSHTPRWVYRNGHGTDARYNQAQCRDCHVDRECSQCHRGQSTFGVHRPGYKYSHGMDARQRVVNCGYCHDLENSCAKCHERIR
ncbi:MAG: cytochrome c3 family protein [Chitinispirillaceae bacterium]|nr:cytochrome c3 family protein [Chitinispirillaceae bacterium]